MTEPFSIEGNPLDINNESDFSHYYESIRYSYHFAEEGEAFHDHTFAYLMLLSHRLNEMALPAQLLTLPMRGLPNQILFRGQQKLVDGQHCLWSGDELFVLSRRHTGRGSTSFFHRIVMIPRSITQPLRFFAMLIPNQRGCFQSEDYLDYIRLVTSEYDNAMSVIQQVYPYQQPSVFMFKTRRSCCDRHSGSGSLPTLITQATGAWTTIRRQLSTATELDCAGFMTIMNWFLSLAILHHYNIIHRDASDNNVVVFGPGIMCWLIDFLSAVSLGNHSVWIENSAYSTFPDIVASDGRYDKQSDVFSIAMSLVLYHATHMTRRRLENMLQLIHLTNKNFGSLDQVRKRAYQNCFIDLSNANFKSSYHLLIQIIFGFINPDRDQRPSMWDLFGDILLAHEIRRSIRAIALSTQYQNWFSDFNQVRLLDSIDALGQRVRDADVAVTSILMMVFFTLHCHRLDIAIRHHHFQQIELLLVEKTLHQTHRQLLWQYEAFFPACMVDSLYNEVFQRIFTALLDEEIKTFIAVRGRLHLICDAIIVNDCITDQCVEQLIDEVYFHMTCEHVLSLAIDSVDHQITKEQCIADLLIELSDNACAQVELRGELQQIFMAELTVLTAGVTLLLAMTYSDTDHHSISPSLLLVIFVALSAPIWQRILVTPCQQLLHHHGLFACVNAEPKLTHELTSALTSATP